MGSNTPKNEENFNKQVRDILDARIYNNAKEEERWELEEKELLKRNDYSIEKINIAREKKANARAIWKELEKIVFTLFKGQYE